MFLQTNREVKLGGENWLKYGKDYCMGLLGWLYE